MVIYPHIEVLLYSLHSAVRAYYCPLIRSVVSRGSINKRTSKARLRSDCEYAQAVLSMGLLKAAKGTNCWIQFIIINPFMLDGLFYLHSSDRSISNIRGVWLAFITSMFIEIPVFNANSVDPDQTPHSAASNLSLHCLPMSL